MLIKIVKHEWRNLRADRILWMVTALFALSVAYAMYNGAAWTNFQKETLAGAAAEERERHAALNTQIAEYERNAPEKISRFSDPRDPAAAGRNVGQRYAAMPPAPLAQFSTGQSDLLPYYFKISTRSQQTFIGNDEIENPTNLLSGRFDVSFVVIYILPLLVLALSYNFLSGEREAGTLSMLLAQPVGLRSVIAGKILARFLILTIPVVGFSLAAFLLGGGSLTAEGAALRMSLWVLAVVAYLAFWLATAVAVNSFGWKSATNAVALAAVWLFLVILIPALANIVVTSLYPVPSRVEMIGAMREVSNEAAARGSRLLAKYMEDHPELVRGEYDPNDAAARTYAVQETVDRRIRPVLARYDEQLRKQQNLVESVAYISPAIILQKTLNDISGTGEKRYRHFLAQVKNYHAEWQTYFVPRIFQKTGITAAVYENSPQFVWREEPPGELARQVFAGFLGISLFTLAIGAGGLFAMRRYPVFS